MISNLTRSQPIENEHSFVVIPAFNEGSVLAGVVAELTDAGYRVVVVDDGSTDDTYEIAQACATFALRHLVNRGQGAALQTGINFALIQGAQYIVTYDADGQHRVQDIAVLLAPLISGDCDISLGSRFLGEAAGIPARRKAILKLGILFTRIVSGMKLTDTHNGLRALTRRAAQKINLQLDGMAHASEILDQVKASGFAYQEVPVRINYTEYSIAKTHSWSRSMRIATDYFVGRATQ